MVAQRNLVHSRQMFWTASAAEMLQALCVVRGGALPRGTAAPFTHPSQREARDGAGPQIREI